MFDVNEIRKDFPMLKEQMASKPLIYFDNSATALKPQVVIDEVVNYYTKMSVNSHRGDYDLSHSLSTKFDNVRVDVANYLNCKTEEIVFTSGNTESLNIVANSFAKHFLKPGDEIILNYAEHASNVLPWFRIANECDFKIVFAELENGILTLDAVKNAVSEKTKLIAFAHVTNTIADTRDVKSICEFAASKNIYTVVDGAQGAPHLKVDLQSLGCDFYTIAAHKMYGPTGVGALYGKIDLLNQMAPYNLGGGMNGRFDKSVCYTLKSVPTVFEAGTHNVAGVLGFGAAIKYINEIGIDNINQREHELKLYALERLSKLPNIKIYNETTENSVVIFNVYDDSTLVFPQDVACYLNGFGIAIRAGDHCAKLLDNVLGTRVTCRASFGFYNTTEEIDVLVDALAKCNADVALQI